MAALQRLAGDIIIDNVLVNDMPFTDEVLAKYKETGAEPVRVDIDRLDAMGVRTIRANMLKDPGSALHDSERLGKVVMDVVYAMQAGLEPHILEYYLKREDR